MLKNNKGILQIALYTYIWWSRWNGPWLIFSVIFSSVIVWFYYQDEAGFIKISFDIFFLLCFLERLCGTVISSLNIWWNLLGNYLGMKIPMLEGFNYEYNFLHCFKIMYITYFIFGKFWLVCYFQGLFKILLRFVTLEYGLYPMWVSLCT